MGSLKNKGVKLAQNEGVRKTILTFLKSLLEKGVLDGILIPMREPAKKSYAWILVREPSILDAAQPLAPIMPVQGAKALSSLTGHGKGKKRITAVVRPCEVRATAELFKLGQVDLENIVLISIDCHGALPLTDWVKDPKKTEDAFLEVLKGEASESLRPVCQICDKFSMTGAEDRFTHRIWPSFRSIRPSYCSAMPLLRWSNRARISS